MDYMLLIYAEERLTGEPSGEVDDLCDGLSQRLQSRGQYVSAGVLRPTSTAKSLRVRDGAALVTDGPFAETREALAGFLMVRAENEGEALQIAAEHPVARFGTVEVRPVYGVPSLKG